MARTSTLLKRLQPMLATLTDAPFDDKGWIFEDKYDGFRMIAKIEDGGVILYSRNGKIISHNYIEVAKALEWRQGRCRHRRRAGRAGPGRRLAFPAAAERSSQQGEAPVLRVRSDVSGWRRQVLRGGRARPRRHHGQAGGQQVSVRRAYRQLAEDQNVEAAGSRDRRFHRRARTRPFFDALTLALREGNGWRYIGHVGTGFSHDVLKELHGKLIKLKTAKSPFGKKTKDEAVTTWVKPQLVAEVKFTEWTSSGEMRHPVYLGLREDKRAEDVTHEREAHLAGRKAGRS